MSPILAAKIVGAATLLALVTGAGVFAYFDRTRPATLGLASVSPYASPAATPSDPLSLVCRRPAGATGLWVIQPGSLAGYRAHEKFEQLTSPHEAVARTGQVGGWLLVEGSAIVTGCVAVDVRTLRSIDQIPGMNSSNRDENARDFLGAAAHPYVVFQPYPAALQLDASSKSVQRARLQGDLEIKGVTRSAEFALDVKVSSDGVAAAGSTVVQVEDFGVEVPQGAEGFVRVDPHITLEVSLVLVRAA